VHHEGSLAGLAAKTLPKELGASEFITKPVNFDRLKEQLRQLPAEADK
jgi:hypothetical protein